MKLKYKSKHIISPYEDIIPMSVYGKIIILALLGLFLAVTLHKLTYAPFWFDEAVEYLLVTLPFGDMLRALRRHLQPPLYNILLWFLVKISIGEFWMRFTSVLFGLLGCIGLYAAVNEVKGWKVAGISIFVYTFLYRIVFYNQEVAEYTLAVACLFWAIYFFACILREFSNKKIAGFILFCILSIFSQYGTMFTVISLSTTIMLVQIIDKNWKNLKIIMIMAASAAIIFGIPLYLGYARFQFVRVQSSPESITNLFYELQRFIGDLHINISFLFSAFYGRWYLKLFVQLFYMFAVCAVIWLAVQSRFKKPRYVGITAILTYTLYYIGIRTGFYARGDIGNRYALLLLPVLFFCFCISASQLFQTTQSYLKKINIKLVWVSVALVLSLLTIHNYKNWLAIRQNWIFQNVRDTLDLWISETNAEDDLFIYYAAVPAFMYYAELRGLDYADEKMHMAASRGFLRENHNHNNFFYSENIRGRDADYVKNSINQCFDNNMPNSLWFIASHAREDDYQIYINAFTELGFGYQVYRWPDARLLRLFNFVFVEDNYLQIIDSSNLSALIARIYQLTQSNNDDYSISFSVDGNDPQIHFALHEYIKYDNPKATNVIIEFESDHAGYLQIFFLDDRNTEFTEANSVGSQYLAGRKKVMVELPPSVNLTYLRLDIDNANVPAGAENNFTLHNFMVLEEIKTPCK